MTHFRCYFLDAGGHIQGAENLACASDGDAIDQARRAFAAQRQYAGFELWEGKRRAHAEWRGEVESQGARAGD